METGCEPATAPDCEAAPVANRRPRLLAALEAWLGTRLGGTLLLVAVVLVYLAAWWTHELRPARSPTEQRLGWWTWADQYAYWQSAEELSRLSLTAQNFHYPLGYPALAAPFMRVWPEDPFLIPNLALVLVSSLSLWRLARLGLSRVGTVVAAAVFVATHSELLALTLVVPWNTIGTQAALLAGITVGVTDTGVRRACRLGLLAAAAYLVRPADAACFAPLLAWAALAVPTWGERFRSGLFAGLPVAAAIGLVGLINLRVFGSWSSPYDRQSWEVVGFMAFPFAQKAYWALVDGRAFFGESDAALLFRYPWLFLVPAGAVAWCRRSGAAALAALAALAGNWGLYLAYNDFVPSAIWRFGLIHYVSWSIPVLFLLAAAAVVAASRNRISGAGLAAGGLLLVAALGLQLEEKPLAAAVAPGRMDPLPAERPLAVSFPGVPVTRAGAVRIDGRGLQESRDYHLPYVPSDLRLLLSARAGGGVLELGPDGGTGPTPQVSTLEWTWRWTPARVWTAWRD